MDEEEFGGIGFPDPAELTPKDIRLSGPFGPAVFGKSPYGGVNGEVDKKVDDEEVDAEPDEEHDIVWVGRISKVFWRDGDGIKPGRRLDMDDALFVIYYR